MLVKFLVLEFRHGSLGCRLAKRNFPGGQHSNVFQAFLNRSGCLVVDLGWVSGLTGPRQIDWDPRCLPSKKDKHSKLNHWDVA